MVYFDARIHGSSMWKLEWSFVIWLIVLWPCTDALDLKSRYIRMHFLIWYHYLKFTNYLQCMHYSWWIFVLHTFRAPHFLRSPLKKPCTNVAHKAAKLLAELSSCIEQMRIYDFEPILEEVQHALEDLQVSLNSQPKLLLHSTTRTPSQKIVLENENREEEVRWATRRRSWHGESSDEKRLMLRHGVEFGEALPLATFAWLVVEIVARLEHVVHPVEELAVMAKFKPHNPSTSDQKALIITSAASPRSYIQRPSLARTPERCLHMNNVDWFFPSIHILIQESIFNIIH